MKDNFENCEFAGFGVRVGSWVIDQIIVGIIIFPWLYLIYGDSYGSGSTVFEGPLDFLITVVLPCIAVILFWYYKNATPGKMVIKAKILDAKTGQPPTLGQCVGRYFAYIVSGLPLGAGFIWIAFDKRKQGWHDKLAGTVVVKEISQPVKAQFPSREKNHEPD